jgi:hypothetical protein
MKKAAYFSLPNNQIELMDRLNRISGASWGEDKIGTHPSIRIEKLYEPASRNRFLEIWSWYLEKVRS